MENRHVTEKRQLEERIDRLQLDVLDAQAPSSDSVLINMDAVPNTPSRNNRATRSVLEGAEVLQENAMWKRVLCGSDGGAGGTCISLRRCHARCLPVCTEHRRLVPLNALPYMGGVNVKKYTYVVRFLE